MTIKIVEYKFIVKYGPSALTYEVNKLLEKGWKLRGGSFISGAIDNEDRILCSQAMVRYEEINEPVNKKEMIYAKI